MHNSRGTIAVVKQQLGEHRPDGATPTREHNSNRGHNSQGAQQEPRSTTATGGTTKPRGTHNRNQGRTKSIGGTTATRAQQQPGNTTATRKHKSNQETQEQPGSTRATRKHKSIQDTQEQTGSTKKHKTGDITAGGGTAAESTTAIRKRATESTVARQRAVHRKPLLKRGSLLNGKR